MEFRIEKMEELSGRESSIYSVFIDNDSTSVFEKFLLENNGLFKEEIEDILIRLETIGKKTGAREGFFKHKEGTLGDGVCALYDVPDKKLRLYCIRYGSQLVLLGGGGEKNVRALQEDPKLKSENYLMRKLSKVITEKLKEGDIKFSSDGLDFEGDLTLQDDEY